ncbi:MAG: class I SAM-dependent methyltransferase [Pirellulales bacterium]
MMTAATAEDDYDWLASPAAAPWLARAAESWGDPLRLQQTLRKQLPAERARLVVEQIDLRRRAKKKFSRAAEMFFTRQTLEQATDEQLAAYKAQRLAAASDSGPWADICCGIGGDLLALAAHASCVGVELNSCVARLARANGELSGASWTSRGSRVVCAAAQSLDPAPFTAWHADPDRRTQGKRTTSWDHCEPPREWFERWWAAERPGAVKLAPATDPPSGLPWPIECEWLGSRGECRQLVVWSHSAARHVGRRSATVCDGAPLQTLVEIPSARPRRAERAAAYLYEAHACVLAADLLASLAVQFDLAIWPGVTGYLTSDRLIQTALAAPYRILETMPFDRRRVREWLRARGVGRVTIKKRGVDIDVPRLERELAGPGDAAQIVCLAPAQGGVIAIPVEQASSLLPQ